MSFNKILIKLKYFIIFLFFFTKQINLINGRLLDTSVACDQHNFMLSLNFDVPFHGLVYSEEGLPNCIYVNGTMLSLLNYHLKIPLNGCETKINSDGNFENGVIIQENIAFLQANDKKYLLTCIPSTPLINNTTIPSFSSTTTSINFNTLISTTTISSITSTISPSFIPLFPTKEDETESINLEDFNDLSPKTKESSSSQIIPPSLDDPLIKQQPSELKYSVEIKSGHSFDEISSDLTPIGTALNIGDSISYLVRIQKPISDSQIGRCWASDSNSSLELSDERGCSLQPKGNIWNNFERIETQDEIIFINRIKAWAFPTSNEVNIFCNLRVCMSKHCSFVANCSENSLPRQRRDDEILEDIEKLKGYKIKLINRPKRKSIITTNTTFLNNNNLIKKEEKLNKFDQNWCISLIEILIGFICFGILLILITAIACFIIFKRFYKFKLKDETRTNSNVWTFLNENKKENEEEKQQQFILSCYFV